MIFNCEKTSKSVGDIVALVLFCNFVPFIYSFIYLITNKVCQCLNFMIFIFTYSIFFSTNYCNYLFDNVIVANVNKKLPGYEIRLGFTDGTISFRGRLF